MFFFLRLVYDVSKTETGKTASRSPISRIHCEACSRRALITRGLRCRLTKFTRIQTTASVPLGHRPPLYSRTGKRQLMVLKSCSFMRSTVEYVQSTFARQVFIFPIGILSDQFPLLGCQGGSLEDFSRASQKVGS